MLIPTNLIKALLKVINPKQFSPVLTYMYYNKEDNKIVWTDSFMLLQFYPHTPSLQNDMYISCNELNVLKSIWKKDEAIEVVQLEKLLKIWWVETECVFYLDPTIDIQTQYPDTNQPWLFWNISWELKKLPVSEWMEKFQEIARLIWWNGNSALITDKTLNLTIQDNYWRYELVYRRPNMD